jgi:uncharacterized membrane protein
MIGSVIGTVTRTLDEARGSVPVWSCWLVMVIAVALAVVTFGYLPLYALGLDMSEWGAWVVETCRPLCHQLPGRSFHISNYVFPLCARCTGMWLGITVGVACAMFYRPVYRWWIGGVIAVVGMSASAIDVFREGIYGNPSAWTRAVAGFVLFWGVTLAVSFDALGGMAVLVRWVGGRRPNRMDAR